MGTFIALLAIAMAVFAAAILFGLLSKALTRWPYRKTGYLLTPAERSFFTVLKQAIDNDLCIFAKVRLSDLLWVPQGTKNRQSYFNRIQSKHVDFVLCDAVSTEPRLLIELDDSSHRRADRRARDTFLDEAVRRADLPILHVPVKRSYAAAELRQLISSLLTADANKMAPAAAVGERAE